MRSLVLYLCLGLCVTAIVSCRSERGVTTRSPDALRHYDEGVSQWEKFYFTDAKTSFEKAIVLDSAFAMAWARLAMVNAASRNETQANADISRALELAGGVTLYEQLYIRMWYYRLNFDNTAASGAADSLIMLYPDSPEAYIARGNIYEMNKEFDAAIQLYQEAATRDTSYAPAAMTLGYAYSAAGEQEKALAEMERYIRLAPDAADPRASYADLLLRVGRYEGALEQYRKSLELKPDYWYAFSRIGDVYTVMGRLKEAAGQYDQAFKLMVPNKQTEASHLAVQASLDIQRGKYREAVEQFHQALMIDSTNAEAAFGLVHALTELRDFGAAEKIIVRIREEFERRNLTESPAMLSFHLMRARLFTEQGLLDGAEAECNEAFDFSTPLTRAFVYRQLAIINLKRKDYDSAFDALEGALRINSNSPQALLTLTKVYHAKGDRRMTREIGGRLIELWKNADPDLQDVLELKQLLGLPA